MSEQIPYILYLTAALCKWKFFRTAKGCDSIPELSQPLTCQSEAFSLCSSFPDAFPSAFLPESLRFLRDRLRRSTPALTSVFGRSRDPSRVYRITSFDRRLFSCLRRLLPLSHFTSLFRTCSSADQPRRSLWISDISLRTNFLSGFLTVSSDPLVAVCTFTLS